MYDMNDKELLDTLLDEFDLLLQIKQATSEEEKQKIVDRRYALLKSKLSAFNTINVEQLEEQYKR